MDFSRPDNARLINTLKTLSAIRENEDMTRAELSRELVINKVSVSEIVDELIKKGLVWERGKKALSSGRPSTLLAIKAEAAKVIGLVIRDKGCLIALSDLKGKILRLERFARGKTEEELREGLSSSLARILKNESVKLYGMAAVTDDRNLNLKDILAFPYIAITPIEAQVAAESMLSDNALENTLFIMLGEKTSAYYRGKVLNDFPHIPLGEEDVCWCGKKGCLDALFSLSSISLEVEKITGREMKAREILSSEEAKEVMDKRLKHLASAIALSSTVLGADSTMLLGPLAEMSVDAYEKLNAMARENLVPWKKDYLVLKSHAGEAGIIQGACYKALDHFFYKKDLLERLRNIESL